MLASPVSPSVSLGSRTHTSSRSSNSNGNSNQSSPNGTYASPRHPAYLPSTSPHNPNQTSPSQHSITSTSSAAPSQTTSNYSKYTTNSQIDRVNDVLVDKVSRLHAPLPSHGVKEDNEKGVALKRLIAFLDGDEDTLQQEGGQKVQQEREHERRAQQHVAGPSHARQKHDAQDPSRSIYTSQEHSTSQSHPSTPPSTHRQSVYPNMPNEIQRDHTPRSSSSQAHLHPSHGRAGHQAPLQTYYQPSQPTQHGTRRSRSPDVRHRSRAENTNEPQPPSQSVLLSTQTQLERLKSEVAHLDELVNRLKSQHIPLDQAQPPSTNHNDGQTYQIQHQQNLNEHEQDNEAAMKAAEEADHIRRTREYESSPASQNDLLRLVRHLDSLVWMRIPHTYTEGAEVRKGNQHEKIGNGISIGKGTRNDDIIFTKGNLDHLARRMGAWENIVRRKQEEARYNYGT